MKNFFCWDGDTFETFETQDEAEGAAEASLEHHRDMSIDGWDEDAVSSICWGTLSGRVVETKRLTLEEARMVEDHMAVYCIERYGHDVYLDYALHRDIKWEQTMPTASEIGIAYANARITKARAGKKVEEAQRALDAAKGAYKAASEALADLDKKMTEAVSKEA